MRGHDLRKEKPGRCDGQTERWQRIKAILDKALELRPDQRSAYLDEACAEDSELGHEVESLLRSHERRSRFLEGGAARYAAGLFTSETESLPPRLNATDVRQVGPYRLLDKLGEGGMGEVWLAEQTEPVKRKVALKVIKRGMDTKQVVARFGVERQALAMMDHPAIAKVYDAGATPRGTVAADAAPTGCVVSSPASDRSCLHV